MGVFHPPPLYRSTKKPALIRVKVWRKMIKKTKRTTGIRTCSISHNYLMNLSAKWTELPGMNIALCCFLCVDQKSMLCGLNIPRAHSYLTSHCASYPSRSWLIRLDSNFFHQQNSSTLKEPNADFMSADLSRFSPIFLSYTVLNLLIFLEVGSVRTRTCIFWVWNIWNTHKKVRICGARTHMSREQLYIDWSDA